MSWIVEKREPFTSYEYRLTTYEYDLLVNVIKKIDIYGYSARKGGSLEKFGIYWINSEEVEYDRGVKFIKEEKIINNKVWFKDNDLKIKIKLVNENENLFWVIIEHKISINKFSVIELLTAIEKI